MIIKHYNSTGEHSILLPDYILKSIYDVAKPHLPCEFGGILTGYRNANQEIIIDFEVPTMFKHTTTGFTRHPGNLNKYLKEVYAQSNGNIKYIGEWHTHPYSLPDFSPKDYKSLDEIAKDKNSKTESPFLLILGMNKKTFSYNLYKYFNGQLILLENKTNI